MPKTEMSSDSTNPSTTTISDGMVGSLDGTAGVIVTGHLEGVDDEGRLLFRAEGSYRTVPVAIGVDLADDMLVRAAALGRRALVVQTTETPARWVLVGLVRERVSSEARDSDPIRIRASLDGETVELTAQSRIELRSGRARIVLHKCGKIELSGTNVITRSRGPVKLKGATIELN